MNVVFADTSYYIALLVPGDSKHDQAMRITAPYRGRVITTTWVLVELASFFSPIRSRQLFVELTADLQSSPDVLLISADQLQFDQALKLYAARTDKSWSLVDCISFEIMRKHGIADAWTSDHHFVQAGFNAVLG